ncbi:MAG TPA: zinc ribbon domain-containing protein [Nitrospirae bacterium]|nr:protein SprT-like protein [bacterium BMS3Abin10]GBE38552.1 protein SprT-like protein [bacterium BMS3Bbin08]HDH50142.1 zinc ribbon domain-containing protein [Nitrospirota bacterium]HDK81895.1 zinc ribbon domain-containing protein [Nitrospirota bacterium]HDO26311.1 zinc ribbon domain-containing protein [Nitrospirota bacterium]
MPIYEYKCTKCNEQFEVKQRITEDPLTECGSCGGKLKKLISSTSFVLKGSGWYVTDYPSEARKKAMEAKKPKDRKKVDAQFKEKSKPAKKTDTGSKKAASKAR